MKRSDRAGFTLVEALMAALIMGVAITAMFSLWTVSDLSIRNTGEVNVAGQIARAQLEQAKTFGPTNFPKGTLSCSVGDGAVWTGTFDPTANAGGGAWVANAVSYFDYRGERLSSSAGAAFSMQITVTDTGDLPPVPCNAGTLTTAYVIVNTTERSAVATVARIRDNRILFMSGTNLVIGGI